MSNEYNIEETNSDKSENNNASDSSVPSLSSASHIGPYQFEPYNNNNSITQATENTVNASPDNNTNDEQSRAGTID